MTTQAIREEIHQQLSSAIRTFPEMLHELRTNQKEQAEKQEEIHREFASSLSSIVTELNGLSEIKKTTEETLKQAIKTNGRVSALESQEFDKRVGALEKESSQFMGAVKMLIFIGAGYVAILTGLAYYYTKDVEHRVASDVVKELQEKYDIKIQK